MSELMKALQGEPHTVASHEDGRTVLTVTARHLRPADAKANDAAAVAFAFGGVGVAIWIALTMQGVTVEAAMVLVAGMFGAPFLKASHREWGHEKTVIRVTEDSISVLRPPVWLETPQWERFDRRHPHRFLVVEHDKAQAERDKIDFQIRNKPGTQITRYYTDAHVVVLEYLGQRFDLMEVMGGRPARDILGRLTLCDEIMNGFVSARQRLPMRPEDEWSGPTSSVPR
jgi:hypothetical protein